MLKIISDIAMEHMVGAFCVASLLVSVLLWFLVLLQV